MMGIFRRLNLPPEAFRGAQWTAAALAAFSILVGGFILFNLGVRVFYSDQVFPGVSTAGKNLGGMTASEVKQAIARDLPYTSQGLIVLQDADRVWATNPHDLGVELDLDRIAQTALDVGREGGLLQRLSDQWAAWFQGNSITPIVVFDQQQGAEYLRALAAQINLPRIESRIGIDGVEVELNPGQIGRELDIDTTLQALYQPIANLVDAQVDLAIKEFPPLVLDASAQAEIAEIILSDPIVLSADGAGPWIIERSTIAEMLQFLLTEEGENAQYQVGLDPEALGAILMNIGEEINLPAQNARFIFNDDTHQLDLIQPAVTGQKLDIPGTINRIHSDLSAGSHEIALIIDYEEPPVGDNTTAGELGIREPVSVVSTYFSGSGSARAQNVKTAAAAFHGILVPPGETLSMAEILGDISLDTGYAEALIIYGDRTIKGVGGGVCQVSTTLFRAAFFGGYPIVERYPHAYRVNYYEIGSTSPGPGFDATVFVPVVDFKFTNDRADWLLLETYVYGQQLVWKFYSTDDGREVNWSSREFNTVEAPKPLYKENPELEKDEIKQIDWEADGLDVVVNRTVSLNGDTIYEDVIETHYLPWRAIFEYGPGSELPEDAITESDE